MDILEPGTLDAARMTRAQRAALPLSADVAQALAEQHGVCIRPLAMRRIDITTGRTLVKEFATEQEAVMHIAKSCTGGLRFHDLRHSYATWLVDDGVPVNMVQRVMGHERSSTTLDLYTRRTDDHGRILQALDDDDAVC